MPVSQIQALAAKLLVEMTVDAVKECGPDGAPAGVLYSAMSEQGASIQQFQQLMHCLVSLGQVTKQGDLYFAA